MPSDSQSTTFEAANLLEVALKKAANDPACGPQFLAELLESKVLIIPAGEVPRVVNGVIAENTKIQIARVAVGSRECIPFFTSQGRLPTGTAYLLLDTKVLFEMTRGASLVMNPGPAYGKEFLPDEVARLLDGPIFRPTERYVAKKPVQVMIGQPSEYPQELVNTLSRLYGGIPEVKRAWVAFYLNPERDQEGGLLIGLDVDAEGMDGVSGQTGIVIESVSKKQKYVDLVRYDGRGVTGYFTDQKPFYEKTAFGRLWRKMTGG